MVTCCLSGKCEFFVYIARCVQQEERCLVIPCRIKISYGHNEGWSVASEVFPLRAWVGIVAWARVSALYESLKAFITCLVLTDGISIPNGIIEVKKGGKARTDILFSEVLSHAASFFLQLPLQHIIIQLGFSACIWTPAKIEAQA